MKLEDWINQKRYSKSVNMEKCEFINKMADDLNISKVSIFSWIAERRYPSVENIRKIVEYTKGKVTAKDLRPELR